MQRKMNLSTTIPETSIGLSGDLMMDLTMRDPHLVNPWDNMSFLVRSLSNINRYNGHMLCNVNVCLHSCIVSALCPEEFALEGLLHDLHEAIVGDTIAPMKLAMDWVCHHHNDIQDKDQFPHRAIERMWETYMRSHFDLPSTMSPEVKIADRQASCIIERRMFGNDWHSGPIVKWGETHPKLDMVLFNDLTDKIKTNHPFLWSTIQMASSNDETEEMEAKCMTVDLFTTTFNQLKEKRNDTTE